MTDSTVRRVAAPIACAGVAGLGASAVDAAWAGASFPAVAGVDAPLAFAVGVFAVLALVLVPSPARLVRGLRASEPRGGAAVAAALAPPTLVLVLAGSAYAALPALASESGARASGAVMALALASIALGGAIIVAGVARALATRVTVDPLAAALVGVAIAVAILAVGIVTGDTSGGGGVLGILGVLGRDELDLRGPALVLGIGAAAWSAPDLTRRVPVVLLAGLALAPLGLTYASATRSMTERSVALAIERGAPLAKLLVPRLRRFGDADRDGASRLFGGGDCDDGNALAFPGAEDVPENGLDEDCSGADDARIALEQPESKPKAEDTDWRSKLVPENANVVLITIDTLRWDLGFAGNARPVSPHIDRLAKRSTVFEKAYALASYTGKSIGPMLIGKYTSETHRGWSHFNRFGREDTFVQERLQKAGIRTIGVQGHWYFKADTGLGRGFDVLDLSAAPKVLQMEGDKTVNSAELTDAAIAQLGAAESTKGRFFLWVHYLDPHAEYVKHDAFDFGAGNRERYDGEVAFTDEHVGRLLAFIEKQPFAKNTFVILTSDHGEAFGEHGLIRHGFEVWEELVRVPFIVYAPGAEPRRVLKRRSAIDLVPTILDIFRAPEPAGEGADFVSGRSLLADVYGPPGHEPDDRIVFVDMSAGPNNQDRQAFIERDMKLIATAGRPLGLYDLAADPDERKDLLDDSARADPVLPRFKEFRRRLRQVIVRPVPK